jgi:hypothetical protein
LSLGPQYDYSGLVAHILQEILIDYLGVFLLRRGMPQDEEVALSDEDSDMRDIEPADIRI